jgi:hypothetical protein
VVTGNCKGVGYGSVHWVNVACGQIQQWVVENVEEAHLLQLVDKT